MSEVKGLKWKIGCLYLHKNSSNVLLYAGEFVHGAPVWYWLTNKNATHENVVVPIFTPVLLNEDGQLPFDNIKDVDVWRKQFEEIGNLSEWAAESIKGGV